MNNRVRSYSIAASICLHIFLFILWVGAERLKLFATDTDKERMAVIEPLIFEFEGPKPLEVIETPDDARTVDKQERADFLSDKNALARNPESDPDLELGDPFARGDLDVHELPVPRGARGDGDPQPQHDLIEGEETGEDSETSSGSEELYANNPTREFPQELSARSQRTSRPGLEEALLRPLYDNLDSRAEDTGGLSFNTYDWNYAPYMLALKRKIERNIFPPLAFTRMGWISGESTLRFRIYPDGRLEALEVLEYTGHQTLMETSYSAIKISVPFPLLPLDFPEEFLEVTARFAYYVPEHKNY